MEFEIEVTPVGDRPAMLVTVHGELDLATNAWIQEVAKDVIARQRPVIFDLADCSFIDAASFRQIVELSNGPSVRVALVVQHQGQAARVLTAMNVDDSIGLFETSEGAVAWLAPPSVAGAS